MYTSELVLSIFCCADSECYRRQYSECWEAFYEKLSAFSQISIHDLGLLVPIWNQFDDTCVWRQFTDFEHLFRKQFVDKVASAGIWFCPQVNTKPFSVSEALDRFSYLWSSLTVAFLFSVCLFSNKSWSASESCLSTATFNAYNWTPTAAWRTAPGGETKKPWRFR